jgi:O-acetyl-ADP-ribose deacetylase (regulator of RNase III)
MIYFKQGNLLESKADALVNTVNCVGIMGKGIALQFKQAFPENFKQYERACRAGEVQLGKMFVVSTDSLLPPRYIINFPTKDHWKNRSRLESIESGLQDLVAKVRKLGIESIAIPPLGCGNGGLDWGQVRPSIEAAFAPLPDVEVLVFEPQGALAVDEIAVSDQKPALTHARAILLKLIEGYQTVYRLTKLEVQKLGYFVQEAGEPMKLQYIKHQFGPYANNLNHLLQTLDGHYITGYGDRSKEARMRLLPHASEEATEFLANTPEAIARVNRVSELVEGFETPYGMELLATTHWVVTRSACSVGMEEAIAGVHDWSDRKHQLFKPKHIRTAWQRLFEQDWFGDNS